MPLNIDFLQILLHVFNFIILFGGLYIILYKPVRNFMEKREEFYRKQDEDAKAGVAEAEKLKAEYQEKLKAADAEIETERKAAEARIAEFEAMKKKEASDEAARILSKSKQSAEAERERIIAGANEEIKEIIENAAARLMLDPDVQNNYDTFLDNVEGSLDEQ